VRAASVGENAVDSAVNHGGLPHSGKVIKAMITALAAGIGSLYLTHAK
jgi:hypothetical protein